MVIPWSKMLLEHDNNPNNILSWVDSTPGGRYHLHGWRSTEGFAFRFERPVDATLFTLRWIS